MSTNSRSPQQVECDPEDPAEHFLWALCQVPWGQEMQSMPPHMARILSSHLVEVGFAHTAWLAGLADENGFIHVDQLPKQKKKLQMPHRGQQSYLNGLARWVPVETEDPEPVCLPDVSTMTVAEQQLMINELRDLGRLEDPSPDLGPLAQITSFEQVKYASDHITTATEVTGD